MLMEDQFEIGKNKGRTTKRIGSTTQINNN
jgi:hypothetical protein